MEQVFRIEIPVEAVDKTDTAALQRLETVLQKIFTSMQRNKTEANDVFDAIERGASEAKAAMKLVENAADDTADSYEEAADAATTAGNKQEQAASSAASSAEKLETTVSEVSDAFEETGTAATDAGRKSGSAFNSATSSADKFTQRIEKSNKSLRSMFKEKLQLTLAAIDRASPVLKSIWNSAKSLAGKTWHVAVRMKDFITAPFRKLWNMISNPITMALSVAGIGLSAGEIVQTFNEFETGMSAVRSLTGATDEEFLLLKQTAKDLGASTSFSASQASEGMQYLAMAGWDTNQIIAAMPGLLNLAAAGATELGTAADIVSDVMTAMGMSADEASRAADVFARTATSSNTTIEGLGDTLKYAAPIAHSFGMELEDVAALAGMMGDAGIKGSQAGTAMRSALLRMADPAEEAATWMEKLGLSFAEGDGSMKSMSAILRDTSKAFSTLTEAERLAAAQSIFGTEAASAWLAVIDQGPEVYDEFVESLSNAKGAAEEMAEIRLDNLAGDMEELGGAVETAKLELMEKLNPYMRSAVQWLTDKIPAVQTLLENAIDSGIEKASALKDHLTGVFGSEEFQNADGFAEKFFVAWDKIIAEPFDKWWAGGGKDTMLNKLSDFGEGAGELLNGVVTGIFAALKGEEIDFEGLNITGLGKAGAEAAKTFISSFLGGLNVGDLFGKAPALMQAGMFGFGAIKIGSGITGTVRTFGALRDALLGTGTAAKVAAPAVGAVGKAAVTSSAGIAKAGTVLGSLKTALAAVPVWGWVAAAAITATAIGIKLYADAQERHRQELLHIGDAVAESSIAFEQSAQQYQDAVSAVEGYKEAKLELEATFKPLTEEDYQTIRDTISMIEEDQIEIETVLANGGLSSVEQAKLSAQLMVLEANKVTLKCVLTPPTEEEKAAIQQQIDMLEAQKIDIQAVLSGAGLSPEDVAALESQIADIEAQKAEIEAKIAGGGLSDEDIAALEGQIADLNAQKAEIEARIAGAGLNAADVAALEKQISDIETSKILLKSTLEPLTEEEIKTLTDKLDAIEAEKVEIEAKIAGGGLPADEVAALEQQIADLNSQEIVIEAVLKSLPEDVVKSYVEQTLGISYEQLIPVLKDTFGIDVGLEELQTGAYDSLIESGAIEETARLNMEAELNRLRGDVNAAKAQAPETLAEISRLESEVAALESSRQASLTEGGEKTVAAAALKAITAGWEADFASFQRGEITLDEIHSRQAAYQQRLYDEVYAAGYVDPEVRAGLTEEQLRQGFDDMINSGSSDFSTLLAGMAYMFENAEGWDFNQADAQAASIAQKQAEIETARAGLAEVYAGETRLVAADAFAGTDYMGMTVEEIASQYPKIVEELGSAGETMFQNMLAGLQELNTQADYVTAEQQTQTVDVIDIAAKAQIMQDVQTQVQTIASSYQQMTADQQASFAASEEGAAQLAAVNEALSSLGLEQIESLDQLNSALETLSSVDLSSFSLEAAQSAFVALGGDADGCKAKVAALEAQLNALDGKSTSSTHTHTNITINKTITQSGVRPALNANGGIYDGAMLSWVAEDGPEAIIPLGAKRRERGLELWLQAGEMLGVTEFADGGIVAPYSGALSRLPDDVWDDDGDFDPPPVHTGNGGNGGGPKQISVNVSANPVYHIDGDSSDDIISKIKAHQKEIAEILGSQFADELEDIISNMA